MAEASANISNEPTCQASESPANPEQPEEANQPEKHGARSLDNEEAALPGKQKIDKLPLPPGKNIIIPQLNSPVLGLKKKKKNLLLLRIPLPPQVRYYE